MMMFVNTSDSSSTVKKELENEESISSSLTNKQQTFHEHMNNLLQKFAMMQSMNSVIGSGTTTTTNSNLLPSSSSSHTQFDDNQLQSNPYENPAFAQYLAMAMAALTTNSGQSNVTSIPNPINNSTIKQPSISSTPSSSSSSSSHVDVVVKQGNSRCEECNIVFYKHESYLVHKKLYCASRRIPDLTINTLDQQQHNNNSTTVTNNNNNNNSSINNNTTTINNRPTSASSTTSSSLSYSIPSSTKFSSSTNLLIPSELIGKSQGLNPDNETLSLSTSSPSILSSRDAAASVSPAASSSMLSPTKQQSAIFQYFCAACGIKYTSYDNLYAHQTYYCLKRNNGSTVAGPASAAVSAVPSAPLSPATGIVSPLPTSPVPSGISTTPQSLLTPQLLAAAASLGAAASVTPPTSAAAAAAAAEALLDFTSPTSLSQQWNALVTAAAVVGAKTGASLTNGLIVGDYNCHKCKASYVSPETLAAHVCSADLRLDTKPEKSSSINQTTSSSSTSTSTTATTSASSLQTYKCTICGYKGHTMRGMRTHVRVHTEELSSTGSFEEDFIVQNTDLPEPSVSRRSSHGNSLTNPARQRRRSNNLDSQLLLSSSCHSNQSISSNETFDSVIRSTVTNYLESTARRNKEQQQQQQQIIDEQQQQQQLKKASSLSSLINENQQQQQSSQSSQQQQQQIQNHNCQFCPYQSNYKGNVIRHIKLVHKEINGSSSSSSLSSLQQQQLVKEAMDVLMGNVDLSALPDDLLMINNNNNNCVESQDFSIIKSKSPTPNKLQMNGCIPSSAIDCSSKSNKQIDIKHNNINNKLQESSMKKNSVTNNLSIAGNKKTTTAATTTTTNETTTTTNKNNDNNDLDSRYCNACNISFTYRNSYLAHKRYYCSSNNNSNNSNDT
uniref:Myb-like protein P n=1 Tax=Dermatophagoides pteronyssinus TaxID=6956 RepID=A0A6P6YL77_DERPT|nr:myb-like protein P [Dermatophagoides pteronyssinus]